jgi:hypothetical protein
VRGSNGILSGRLLLSSTLLVAVVTIAAAGSGIAGRQAQGAPRLRMLPTVRGPARVGVALHGSTGHWSGERPVRITVDWLRCRDRRCLVLPRSRLRRNALTFVPARSELGARLQLRVHARNAHGSAIAASLPTAPIALASEAATNAGMYFGTLPASATLPRTDRLCRALVRSRSFEPRPDNYAANHTVPSERVRWPTSSDQLHWRRWIAKRTRVNGNYTGTTDEIIRWGACKWGIDEDTIRAAAVVESRWHQSTVGDSGGSFGLLQVKDHYRDGTVDLGGYPWTQRSTALNVDFYAAWLRSCLDGDFYDGGPWLYNGKQVRDDLWGCVGAWYSGDWYTSGARAYSARVADALARKAWLTL